MTERPSLPRELVGVIVGYALFELYLALRPPNLTEQITEWMETAHGRFASYLASRPRRPSVTDPPPVGFDD